jgi:hypothetical protein
MFLDPNTNTMKSAVVNKQSLEDYCHRNGLANFVVEGKVSEALTKEVNNMLSQMKAKLQEKSQERARREKVPLEIKEIHFTKAAITMTVAELRNFFQALQKHGIPDQKEIFDRISQSEHGKRKSDSDQVTLRDNDLKHLQFFAEKIYNQITELKHDVEEAAQRAPATLKEIKEFKFDQQKVEQRLKQLIEPSCEHILQGGLASKESAVALLEKISPKQAEREKIINNPAGVVKDMGEKTRDALRQIIRVAGHEPKF